MGRASILLLFLPCVSGACNCLVSRSTCQEVLESNLVFIGTVDAIQPGVLDRWNGTEKQNLLEDPLFVAFKNGKPGKSIDALRDHYLKILFDLPNAEKTRIVSAQSLKELETEITWIQSQGTRIRFQVRTLFQQKDDDDDDSKKVAEKPEYVDVWNEAADCGFPFQKGETYLVYATNDEETDRMETNICHRTIRLSDADEDLSYLFFFQNGGTKSLRLEGFVTSDLGALKSDQFKYTGKIKSPVQDVFIEVSGNGSIRHTETDPFGRFVVDGLSEGEYQVSVFASGFPARREILSGPTRVRVQTAKCSTVTLLAMTAGVNR